MQNDPEVVEIKNELKKLTRDLARLQGQIADIYRLIRK
jgi:hypothetical protein